MTSLSGAISSSTQISDLGFVTGSYTTINSFNSLTQSFNSISQSFNVISGSVGTVDFSTLATTGSNIFKGEQIISSSLIVTNEIKGTGSIFLQPDVNDARKLQIYNTGAAPGDVHIKGTTGLTFLGDDTNYVAINDSAQTITITGSNGVYVGGIAETVGAFSQSVDSRLSNLQSTSASVNTSISNLNSATSSYETKGRSIVSGSSQLTSSFDTRYVISGSVGATPSGTISGSSQLTSSFDLRYLVTGSVTSSINALNTFTSSINSKTSSLATTGSNSFNGSQQITGSLLVSQNITGSASASFVSLAVNTTTPTQKVHLKGVVGIENGTTGGNTADQFVFGYAGSNLTQYTHKIQTGHDAQAALNRMDFLLANSSTTWKTPLQLRPDVINISGSLIVTGSINGAINATNGVLSGSTQITPLLPAGTISGSSQLTSSYDSRYLTIGGDSVISGSSQLTSSFDTRYAISASFVSSSNLSSIQTITSASYAALTPVSGTLYIIIG